MSTESNLQLELQVEDLKQKNKILVEELEKKNKKIVELTASYYKYRTNMMVNQEVGPLDQWDQLTIGSNLYKAGWPPPQDFFLSSFINFYYLNLN